MLEISKPLQNYFRVFCICLIAIFLLPIVYLLIIILCTPYIIYRKCIFYLAPKLKPELGKMLNLSAMIFINNCPLYKDPKYATVVYEMEIEGEIELDQFRKDFFDRILDRKNEKDEFVYPELKQNIVPWMGHLFYKNDKDFKVDEHIKPWIKSGLTNTGNNSEEINRIRKEISIEDFAPDKPYWIIYFLFNAESQKTLLFLKQHHSYFDGVSTLHLFINFLNGKSSPIGNQRIPQNFCQNLLEFPIKIWRAFYISAENFILSLKSSQEWKRNISTEEFLKNGTVQDLRSQTFHIPFDKLRKAANANNVNVSSIVLAGISGGLRRYHLKHDLKFSGNPTLGFTIPRPGHPIDKLRNHVYGTYLPTPMCNPNARKRLQLIFQSWEKIKNSYYPDLIHFLTTTLYMNLPRSRVQKYRKFVLKLSPFLVCYSGLPGPKEKLFWRGKEFQFTAFYPMLLIFYRATMPIIINSISNTQGIDFLIHGGFPSEDSVRELSGFIQDEIDELLHFNQIQTL